MASAKKMWSISAEWILPGDGRTIHNGVLRGSGAVVEAIGTLGKVPPTCHHRDLGEVIVLPGFVNAHTHLEFTHLRGKLPRRRPMPQWFFALWRHRPTASQQEEAIADGAAEALATGTTALADVCHNHRAWPILKDSPLRKLCLAEVLGIGPLARGAIPRLSRRLAGCRASRKLRFGVAPHAPYSTSEEVYRHAVDLTRRRGWAVATHLAETETERQYLLRGTGKLFEFLARLGMIDSTVQPHKCKPMQFARRVGLLAAPSILAHVNTIDDEEMELLADSRASVVYCPGSSEFFGRTGHRYPEMLAAGINVALGTDSLASNDSLCLLKEMKRLRKDARVDNATILRMATLHGATALGWEEQIGSLTPGKQADFIVLPCPGDITDPLETVLTCETPVLQTVIGGKTVFSRESV